MSAEDNIQTIKRMYAAFNNGDRPSMLACLADNVHMSFEIGAEEFPWAGDYHGHAGFELQQDRFAEAITIDRFEQLDFLASETQVAVVNSIDMTIKKNGRKVSLTREVQLYKFDGAGKVAFCTEIVDPTQMIAAFRA